MPYEIELEDCGQDLIRLAVDEGTGEIIDAGLMSHLYADGAHFVALEELAENRLVKFRTNCGLDVHTFNWPMTKLSLNGAVLCEAA